MPQTRRKEVVNKRQADADQLNFCWSSKEFGLEIWSLFVFYSCIKCACKSCPTVDSSPGRVPWKFSERSLGVPQLPKCLDFWKISPFSSWSRLFTTFSSYLFTFWRVGLWFLWFRSLVSRRWPTGYALSCIHGAGMERFLKFNHLVNGLFSYMAGHRIIPPLGSIHYSLLGGRKPARGSMRQGPVTTYK